MATVFAHTEPRSNPFSFTLQREHAYQFLWKNGPILGVGSRTSYGFPCRAIVVDAGSLAASVARVEGQAPPRNNVDGWQIKFDLLKLAANVGLAFISALILAALFDFGQKGVSHRLSKA